MGNVATNGREHSPPCTLGTSETKEWEGCFFESGHTAQGTKVCQENIEDNTGKTTQELTHFHIITFMSVGRPIPIERVPHGKIDFQIAQ
jgi:hypothetical protein